MIDDLALGPGREFEAIRAIVERLGARARGIGDDAAIVKMPRGDSLVVSVDSAIEGRHFRRHWLSPRDVGYRSVAAALSDLAAMAARPLGVLLALGVPGSWRDSLLDIADGIAEAVDAARTVIVGGNLTDAGELSITTTVLGSAYAPLTRAGARPGDRVYVTGRLGGPGSALAALDAGGATPPDAYRRFARPEPRLTEADWLADRGATAAIDISDGLTADLAHLAAASKATITVDVERVPIMSYAERMAALSSGEEYELIVTAAGLIDAAEFERRFALPLTEVGVVSHSAEVGQLVLRRNGEPVEAPRGHDHFA